MAHYASHLDVSPATAPAIPPRLPQRQTSTQLPTHGSHLTLPALRSTSPLPPIGQTVPHEIELASETQSVSSASGVTYSFPTTTATDTEPPRNPFSPTFSPSTAPQVHPSAGTGTSLGPAITSASTEVDEKQFEMPAWAEEGLGNNELSTLPISASLLDLMQEEGSRSGSPLPPGAAPPRSGTEPERSGTI